MDHPYSPNSTIEIPDDRLADQYFLSINTPLSALPPPPPIPFSTASSNSIRQDSVNSYQLETETNHQSVFSNPNAFDSVVSLPDNGFYSNNFIYNATDYELENPSIDSLPDYNTYYHPAQTTFPHFQLNLMSNFDNTPIYPPYTPTINDSFTPAMSDSLFTPNSTFNNEEIRAPIPPSSLKKSPVFKSLTPGKVLKKSSTARLNSHLVVQTQVLSNNAPVSGPISSLSTALIDTGVSPLCHKYKYMELANTPTSAHSATPCLSIDNLPQMTTFRHNSDSSNSSYLSETMTPRRNEAAGFKSRLNKKLSHRSLAGDNVVEGKKPKKHTRRRLLPRSKDGCWICRIKHLKCDETRPVCSSCSRFGIQCDFSPKKPDYVTDKELRKQKLIEITEVRKATQKPKLRSRSKVKLEVEASAL